MSKALSDLKKEIEKCRKCKNPAPWSFPKRNNVAGVLGDSDIMFVGDRPSTGEWDKANELFYDLLRNNGFERAHLTDITKCGRKVKQKVSLEEIRNCLVYFERELAIIRPRAIVALGNKTHTMLQGLLPALWKQDVQLEKIWHYSYASRFKKEEEYEARFRELKRKLDRKVK